MVKEENILDFAIISLWSCWKLHDTLTQASCLDLMLTILEFLSTKGMGPRNDFFVFFVFKVNTPAMTVL